MFLCSVLSTVLAVSGCPRNEKEGKCFNIYSESSARLGCLFRGFLESGVIQSVTLDVH